MPEWKKHATFATLAIVAIPIGIASRQFGSSLPSFIADNAGDAIWAAMVYCGISSCVPHKKVVTRVALTLGFAYAIELSQLYHAAWIDSIRETTLGGLVLGFQFSGIDLLRYAVGATLCGTIETAIVKLARSSQA